MAISVRSASKNTATGAGTSFTVPVPSGTAAGDLLVAFTTCPSSNYTDMTSNEFTQTGADASTANGAASRVWLRTAGGSEPANFTFGRTSGQSALGEIVALVGADTANPVDAALTWNTGAANTSQAAPSVSPANTGSMLVCGWESGELGSPSYTVPGSMTEQADQPNGNFVQALATELLSASGATGTRTATASGTALLGWNAFSIAIKVASSKLPPPPTNRARLVRASTF